MTTFTIITQLIQTGTFLIIAYLFYQHDKKEDANRKMILNNKKQISKHATKLKTKQEQKNKTQTNININTPPPSSNNNPHQQD